MSLIFLSSLVPLFWILIILSPPFKEGKRKKRTGGIESFCSRQNHSIPQVTWFCHCINHLAGRLFRGLSQNTHNSSSPAHPRSRNPKVTAGLWSPAIWQPLMWAYAPQKTGLALENEDSDRHIQASFNPCLCNMTPGKCLRQHPRNTGIKEKEAI